MRVLSSDEQVVGIILPRRTLWCLCHVVGSSPFVYLYTTLCTQVRGNDTVMRRKPYRKSFPRLALHASCQGHDISLQCVTVVPSPYQGGAPGIPRFTPTPNDRRPQVYQCCQWLVRSKDSLGHKEVIENSLDVGSH